MVRFAISANKANRLYWLGRYTERVYTSLHLLRRYYDKMIDGEPAEYEEYNRKLDIPNPYPDAESYARGFMYDESNPSSLLSGMTAAHDNAIVLREEIMSETLSYIQLALSHIRRSAQNEELNITDLQSVTDWLLAFWGSIDERVFDERVRHIIKIGKLVENIDLHIRFDYPFYRIKEAFESIKHYIGDEEGVADLMVLEQIDKMLDNKKYDRRGPDYKSKILQYVNQLVLL